MILLVGSLAFGQEWEITPPDYDQIEARINDATSPYYYPVLMDRYTKADTTLTLQEKRHLYYGYVFQPGYTPYDSSDFTDSLSQVLRKENHTDRDLDKIIRYGDSLLAGNPFDLRILNYQMYALQRKEDHARFEAKMIQSRAIMDALLSSGDGTSKSFSFYVINTSHEYGLLGILGFDFGGSQSLIDHYDYLTVAENDYGIDGLYFDVTPCLNRLKHMLEQ